jgi:hypothetical protein
MADPRRLGRRGSYRLGRLGAPGPAGVRAIYVESHYDEPAPVGAHVAVAGLPEAATWIQQQGWAPEGPRDD